MAYFTTKDNVQIWYEEFGEGDRYLLCTQCSHSEFSFEKELAKRGFHVYLLTNRGFGRSTHVTEDYGQYWYDRFAEDVIEFADFKGIGQFTYSGASHGAGTGWHVVMNHQDRVNCFFAVVPGPHSIDEGAMSYRKMIMEGKVAPPVMTWPSEDPALLKRRELEKEKMDEIKAQPDYEAIFESAETKAIDYGRPLTRLGNEEALKEMLRGIDIPVLMIGGIHDPISRPDLMVRTAQCLKNCKMVIYTAMSHNIDIYEETANEAVAFYENVMKHGTVYAPVVNP